MTTAKKMLEALKRALFVLENTTMPACVNGAGTVEMVRDAIADAEAAKHYPRPAAIVAFADFLAEHDEFQDDQLAEAYYDWRRDSALLYEGERHDVIVAAWEDQGLRDEVEAGSKGSFIKPAPGPDDHLQLAFDLAKHVIDVRLAERDAAKAETDRKARKDKLLGMLARKEDDELADKSPDELRKMIEDL